MAGAFDPYYKWLGIPRAEQPPNHYRLLSLAIFEDDVEVIEGAADRQMAHVRTFQSGPHSADSQKLLNELAAARICLLDRPSKARYDAKLWRRLGITQTPAPLAPRPIAVTSPASGAIEAPVSPAVVIDSRRTKPRSAPARHRAPAIWSVVGATALSAAALVGVFIGSNSKTTTAIRPPSPKSGQTSPPEISQPQSPKKKSLQERLIAAPPAESAPPAELAPAETSDRFEPEPMPAEEPPAEEPPAAEPPAKQPEPASADDPEPFDPQPPVENIASEEVAEATPPEKPKIAAGEGKRELKRPRVIAKGKLPAASEPGLPPGVRLLRDIKYGRRGEGQTLDLYLPMKFAPSVPLVIWIHGGGWESLGKQPPWPALCLIDKGYAVASINYRLSGEAKFPAQIHDCKAAIRWLRANAKRHGIDPERFGVWGESAGGHLAALVGASGGIEELEGTEGEFLKMSSRVQAVCDWCGPTDLEQFSQFRSSNARLGPDYPKLAVTKLLGSPVEETNALAEQANPITFVSTESPPFLIMHGDRDGLVPLQQSELLFHALRNAGGEAVLRVLPGKRHESFQDAESLREVETFFNRTLGNGEEEEATNEVRLVATYTHQAGKLVAPIEFFSNGRLESPESGNTWLLRGNQLVMCWYNPKAKPFGVFVDASILSNDGRIYQGQNQDGARIVGERISGENLKAAERSRTAK